jgi:hypothetical protein
MSIVIQDMAAVNRENAWAAYDHFVLELGGDPSAEEQAWWAAQEEAGDDFPTPLAGATQPTLTPMDETSPEAYRA